MWGCCKLVIHPKWNDSYNRILPTKSSNGYFQGCSRCGDAASFWSIQSGTIQKKKSILSTQSSNGYCQGCSKCGGAASYWSIQSGTIHKTAYYQPNHQTDTFKHVLGVGMLQAFDPSKVERSKKPHIINPNHQTDTFKDVLSVGVLQAIDPSKVERFKKPHIINPIIKPILSRMF